MYKSNNQLDKERAIQLNATTVRKVRYSESYLTFQTTILDSKGK